MQRLFSTFANGWPGFGLLMQRLVTGIALLHNVIAQLEAPAAGLMIPEMTGAVLGLFILAGLWTPLVGALIAAVELWIVLAGGRDIWLSIAPGIRRHVGQDRTRCLVNRCSPLRAKASRKLNTNT